MSQYEIKRGYSNKAGCYMYGVYKDNVLQEKCILFSKRNAALIIEWMTLIDNSIIDKESGMGQVLQIMNMDRRKYNGKFENKHK